MVRNREGELLMPSVVSFAEGEITVGARAKEYACTHPDVVAVCAKRDMGKKAYCHPIHGKWLPPEVIQAYLLRQLKQDIAAVVGDSFKVVVTVPAYFDEPRRQATADAAEMAGLSILDIVNEPTAAALSFGEQLGYLTTSNVPREEMKVLIYDLGGGTFDVTLIQLSKGLVRTLVTDGDVRLGGRDWDQRLVDFCAEAFLQQHGDDPRQDACCNAQLYRAAEQAKHKLSVRADSAIMVEMKGRRTQVKITRQQFEDLTGDLLQRTNFTTRQVMAAADVSWHEIDRVLLVGGSVRMPMVSRMLEELSGLTPDHSVNADEAVARGAALYAGYLLSAEGIQSDAPNCRVVSVNAHSLGIEGTNKTTARKQNSILIPRNSPLPTARTRQCATKIESQKSVVVKVLEGESIDPRYCSTIGKVVIHQLPKNLPKGYPIEVTYRYATNGRLDVRAHLPGTQCTVAVKFLRETGVSTEHILQWKEAVASQSSYGEFETMLEEVLEGM